MHNVSKIHLGTNIERFQWVDAAKGISMLLVVSLYVGHSVSIELGQLTYLDWLIAWTKPFRMPEFFLISGLFLGRVIKFPFGQFFDRRVVHFAYFYLLWMIIHIGLKQAVFAGEPWEALESMAVALVQPYGILWFIYVLALFGLAAKLLFQTKVPIWLSLPVAYAVSAMSIETGAFAIDQFLEYFVFFHVGQIFGASIIAFVEQVGKRQGLAWIGVIVWSLVNTFLVFWPNFTMSPGELSMGYVASIPGLQTLSGIAGAIAICVLARLTVDTKVMKWLAYFGERSLFTFVSFVIVMGIARIVLEKAGLAGYPNYYVTLLLLASTAIPVIGYIVISRVRVLGFLIVRPTWVRLGS